MLLLHVLVAAGTAGATAPVSDPPTTRYRIEQQIETRIDLTAFGQGEQVQPQTLVWFTTVSFADSARGYRLTVRVDSLQADLGATNVPQATIDSMAGTVFRGYMDPSGRVSALQGDRAGTFPAMFEGQFRGLHPTRGSGAEGAQWSDTLAVATRTTQAETDVVTISSYTHRGAAADGGSRLEASFASTTTGTVQTPVGPAAMAGTGTGTANYVVAGDGRLLEASVVSTGTASISGDFAPVAIPLKILSTTTVAVLR